MQFKWLVIMLTVWIAVSFICGTAEGALLGGGVKATDMDVLMNADILTKGFWQAWGNVMSFNYPALFTGSYAIFRWVLFMPFCIAFAIMMIGWIMAHVPIIGRGT